MRCNGMPCDVMRCPCDAMRCYAMPCDAIRCHAMPMPCHAIGDAIRPGATRRECGRRSRCAPETQPAIRALSVGGRYLVVGFASGTIPSPPLNLVLLKESCVMGVFWGAWRARRPEERYEAPGPRLPCRAGEPEELITRLRARLAPFTIL